MSKEYIEQRDGVYWVSGSRVSLDSVVYTFLEGLSPETIRAECFPVLNLEQVYGAITYYLANRAEIDHYLAQRRTDYETLRQTARDADPVFYQRMNQAKAKISNESERY